MSTTHSRSNASHTVDHRTASIVLDEDLPLVHVWRDFDAPPEEVMRAHTDPDLFARWIGPHGLTTHVDVWECRTLGAYRYVQREGDEEYAFRGTFPDVRADRIVQTFCYEPWPDAISLDTLTVTDLGDGRTCLHTVSQLPSFEARDAMVASGMETGIREGYEKLDRLLTEGATA